MHSQWGAQKMEKKLGVYPIRFERVFRNFLEPKTHPRSARLPRMSIDIGCRLRRTIKGARRER
jgi:hypothetical protein